MGEKTKVRALVYIRAMRMKNPYGLTWLEYRRGPFGRGVLSGCRCRREGDGDEVEDGQGSVDQGHVKQDRDQSLQRLDEDRGFRHPALASLRS